MSDETTTFPLGQVQNNNVATATQGGTTTTTSTNLADYPSSPGGGTFGFPFVAKDQFTFGTLDFSEFKAVLEFIKSRANTDVVSNPRIATVNNREALINVGNTLNLPTYERNSTTGKMEITGYEAKDLGIILKVTPHINQKNEIVVDLSPQISDLLRYDTLDRASGIVAPVFSTRQAKTEVMIKDGDTIFIGGLIKENDVNIRKKLPFVGDLLGDVPFVGLLFTKKDTIKQKTELIFFITVNLVQTGKAIKDVPTIDKAYVPAYTLTQEGAFPDKKRVKKKK
jgi:type II secretory pathway component GspD/PulD (secretin)